jgi:hypothetical protein
VAANRRAGVARELDEVEVVMGRDRTRQVGDEEKARLQRPDEERLGVAVVRGDLSTEAGDTAADLLRRQVDLADAIVGR